MPTSKASKPEPPAAKKAHGDFRKFAGPSRRAIYRGYVGLYSDVWGLGIRVQGRKL